MIPHEKGTNLRLLMSRSDSNRGKISALRGIFSAKYVVSAFLTRGVMTFLYSKRHGEVRVSPSHASSAPHASAVALFPSS